MKYCTNCGAPLADSAQKCPICSTSVPGAAVADNPPPDSQPSAQEPQVPTQWSTPASAPPPPYSYQQTWEPQPPCYTPVDEHHRENSPLEPGMTTGQYLLTLLLFMIPIVGLILMLIWGFGGTDNPARKKLAQAYMIRTTILTVIGWIAAIWIAFTLFTAITNPLNDLSGFGSAAPYSSFGDYGDWGDYEQFFREYLDEYGGDFYGMPDDFSHLPGGQF